MGDAPGPASTNTFFPSGVTISAASPWPTSRNRSSSVCAWSEATSTMQPSRPATHRPSVAPRHVELIVANLVSPLRVVQAPRPQALPRHHGAECDRGRHWGMRDVRAVIIIVLALTWRATAASGQTVTVVHNVNLRPDPSSEYTPIRLLAPSEPPLTLLDAAPESGYYHVRTSSGEEGYVWSRYV